VHQSRSLPYLPQAAGRRPPHAFVRGDVDEIHADLRHQAETKGRDEAIARFKKSGGQPPKGAKLLGRWTAVDFSGGFDLIESDDARALTEFSLMWSDLMELRIVPVLEDAELGEVLGRIR
jgi:hypothetical protein